MESHSSNIRQEPSPSARAGSEPAKNGEHAPGRLNGGQPVAVVDIGSNSVRLVVYEGLRRSPTPLFNEKVLCGLGRNIATTEALDPEGVELAEGTLRRFRSLCDQVAASGMHIIATAAVREASNGAAFVQKAQEICRAPVEILSGEREAELAARGIVSGVHEPDGVVADLGGGSLELNEIFPDRVGKGVTLPVGGLRLRDLAGRSMKKAEKLAEKSMEGLSVLEAAKGRDLFAVGGTFRALSRLHMAQTGYPLRVMQGYAVDAEEALEYCRLVRRVKPDTLSAIESVSTARRALLPYGAMVLEHLIRQAEPARIVTSALGLREGLLYELLPDEERAKDPLIEACYELGYLRSRSPAHALELCSWSDRFMTTTGLEETAEERRLRHAACLLADIGWRAHPDYRGEQSLNIIANAGFVGVNHAGRAFLALAVYYRHMGLVDDSLSPRIRELTSARTLDRARILGAVLRVGYLVGAAMPGVINRTDLIADEANVVLRLPGDLANLAGGRVLGRLRQLSRLIGRGAVIET